MSNSKTMSLKVMAVELATVIGIDGWRDKPSLHASSPGDEVTALLIKDLNKEQLADLTKYANTFGYTLTKHEAGGVVLRS